jgi:hypothetical protein
MKMTKKNGVTMTESPKILTIQNKEIKKRARAKVRLAKKTKGTNQKLR